MKHHIVYLLAVITLPAFSQNKTLGVGTATSNPNAALHVESPTNNQGFIMPRLSTLQRNAISLAAADKGLMLYDTDVNKPYYWDGGSWQPAAGLAFPYIATDASGTASFSITNTGAGFASTFLNSGTGSAAQFSISNAASSASVLSLVHTGSGNAITANAPIQATQFVGDGSLLTGLPTFTLPFTGSSATGATSFDATNTGVGSAGYFSLTNVSNGSPSLTAYTAGTGHALNVQVNNASNSFAALNINHAGTGNAITANRPIQASAFIGDGSLLTGVPVGAVSNAEIVDGTIGSEDLSSSINITTSGNISAANFVGDGSGLTNLPTGLTLPYNNSLASSSTLFDLNASGTGGAGRFEISGSPNSSTALEVMNAGTGYGIYAENSGSAGTGLQVVNSDPGNPSPAISASQDGLGFVAQFQSNNPGNSMPAVYVNQSGTGHALSLSIGNGGSSADVLNIVNFGSGRAINASGIIQATEFIGDGSQLTNLPPAASVAANAVSGTEIADLSIGSEDLSPSINIATSGNISTTGNINASIVTATSFSGDGSALTNLPASGWGLTGNAGTIPGTNFIGTSDNTDFSIRTNSTERIHVNKGGFIGINKLPGGLAQLEVSTTTTEAAVWGTSNGGGANTYGLKGDGLGTGINTYGAYASATGGATTNYGVYATAQNGSTNWAGYFDQGNVAIEGGIALGIGNDFGTAGKVLTSQGPGSAPIWSTSSGWNLGGNTGTNPATNFIGTTDAQEFIIKANNVLAMRVMPTGQVGVNSTPVAAQMDVGTTTQTIGLHAGIGTSSGVNNKALSAYAQGSSTSNFGLYATGVSNPGTGVGVYAEATGTGGTTTGVLASGLGTGSSNYGIDASATTAATTNYGIYATAQNGSTNWAGYFDQGNVAIKGGLAVGAGTSFGTAGQVLTSQGPGVAPSWTAQNLTINAGSESVYGGAGVGTGPEGVFLGNQAGATNISASGNTFIGRRAGTVNAAGTSNTFIGWNAGAVNGSGNSNVMIGAGAGTGVASSVSQTFGNNNILIGTHADIGTDGLNNAIAIGFGAVVNTNDAMVLGDASNMKVGIGTSNPVSRLHVLDATTVGSSVQITKTGTGDAMSVNVTGSSGRGNVISITSGANPNVALETSTAGFGMAGLFQTTNGSNSSPVVQAISNGSGPTVQVNPSGGGIAVDMLAGTLRYYVLTVNTPGSIPTRAGVYEITNSGGSYTLPTFALSGETCLVYNNTGVSVTVEGLGIASQLVRQFVKIGSAWKVVN